MLAGRIFCIGTFGLVCTMMQTMADRKKAEPGEIPPPPPLAVPLEIEVYKGDKVSIPLIARGRAANEANFILRSRPHLGRLGPVQIIRPGQASVEYQHADGPVPAVDEFTFAVQSPGSPVSAPARVQIAIRLRPAEILQPEPIEFGEVLVGRMGEAFLTLSNIGGEPLQTKILAGDEWIFPEGNEIIVGGGEALRIPIFFRPVEDREYAGVIRFSHDEKFFVPISGRGLEPLRWNPQRLAIQQASANGTNSDFLELENRTKEELRGQIDGTQGITLTNNFAIPPGGSLRIPIRPAEGFITGYEGSLRITHQHGFAEVPYRVFPAPAHVLFHPSNELDFGEIPARESAERVLLFENRGGLPASVSLTPPPGIEAGASMDFQLTPGDRTELPLIFQSRRPGPWSGILKVRVGSEESSLPLRAIVTEAPAGERSVFISTGNRQQNQPPHQTTQLKHGSAADTQTEVPWLTWDNLRVVSQNPTTVVLEWDTEISKERRIEIQQRAIGIDADGSVEIHWEPSPHADVFRSGDHSVRATIFGLQPGMRLNLRYAVTDGEGELHGVSEMLVVETPLPEAGLRIPWGWLLVVFLVAFVIWHIRKRHLAELAATDAEIRRLEENK